MHLEEDYYFWLKDIILFKKLLRSFLIQVKHRITIPPSNKDLESKSTNALLFSTFRKVYIALCGNSKPLRKHNITNQHFYEDLWLVTLFLCKIDLI